MKIEDIKKAGAFVSDEVVRKPVTWKNREGKTFKFDAMVKRRSYGQIERTLIADDKSRGALTISESIVAEDGSQVFSYEEAFTLEPSLATVLLKAIGDVNTIDQGIAAKN